MSVASSEETCFNCLLFCFSEDNTAHSIHPKGLSHQDAKIQL